ncbi:glycosyltransferase involved in cell wall biosynthesis [Chitinophaga polysaccharea]|uniref:Glycosyltransferase involved in cell wall biosynthesis n=1 Tax=Chitinophaga polysaccharea TaxID=1293035 RepID=A0A561Q1X1_9BACT|nr:glycosyltransferase family 2 protein [Chitinophaga polysaccharea]TWF44330.1 glycosyltransferase involved in cell wall biosynthesis [Chitinophaga polysaccharea]
MELPLVSVILPCYNAENYIANAVDSIINQTYRELEIIIIDDCSTDGSSEILRELAAKDNRIKLLRNDINLKLVATLNRGISVAIGQYIVRMDADDISYPDRIEKQVAFMERHPNIGISGTAIMQFEDGKEDILMTLPTDDAILKAKIFTSTIFFHPTVIIRSDVLRSNHLAYNSNYHQAEDWGLWIEMIDKVSVGNIKEPLLRYRIVPNSETRIAEADSLKRSKTFYMLLKRKFEIDRFSLSDDEVKLYTYFVSRQFALLLPKDGVAKIVRIFDKILNQAKDLNFSPVTIKYMKLYFSLRLMVTLIYGPKNTLFRDIAAILKHKYLLTGLQAFLWRKKLV